jgi:hypothetical protein
MKHQIGLKIRNQIHKFSGELSQGLGKVKSRFIEEAIYGLQARGSVRLTEIARALDESIKLNKTHERLCRNLSDSCLKDVLGNRILEEGSSHINNDTLLIVDPSDITKKYARKMEHLCDVRDGSDGSIGKGYWLCEVVGAEVGSSEITPLAQSLWSQEAPGFTSENEELLSLMHRVRSKTQGRGIFVMDRGGDRREIYKELVPKGYRFLIRQRGDRHLIYKGKKHDTNSLACNCKFPYVETVVKEKNGKETVYNIEFGYLPVYLPEYPNNQLWLVVVKGFASKPMMLLTTEPMRKNRKVLWWAVEAYITRWRIEETIRFIKQSYQLEDVRVLTYVRLQNLLMLVFACFFFNAVWLGMKAKLSILALHVMNAAKCLFGLPNFIYYTLACGIKEILMRVGKGPLYPRGYKAIEQPKQLNLFNH